GATRFPLASNLPSQINSVFVGIERGFLGLLVTLAGTCLAGRRAQLSLRFWRITHPNSETAPCRGKAGEARRGAGDLVGNTESAPSDTGFFPQGKNRSPEADPPTRNYRFELTGTGGVGTGLRGSCVGKPMPR